ncbi:DUF664 domain-containing protein [Deinococcus sp.]|uniref:DinB family protein n=1 Tax=Deinococcus sp. TaxID=47478 RepID=UPI0025F11489|nr:DUF664 domain-containing protein [Deinococcus sp.]
MTPRPFLILTPSPATTPEVGALLAVLHGARAVTLKSARRIGNLDAAAVGGFSTHLPSAGTLLYHIAMIELDWLYVEVLEKGEDDFPAEARSWLPLNARNSAGHLSPVTGEPLERHLKRLDWVRGLTDGVFSAMTLGDFRRPRIMDAYDVTPEWVLMHLALHEAHHEGQLALLV